MSAFKQLTKDITKKFFYSVIKKSNTATTLDIKNELRNNGYYALQKDVSEYMQEIASEEDIDYTTNGVYNTYYTNNFDGDKSTTIADSFDSKTNPIYNSVVDVICTIHTHLDSNFVTGRSFLKFDLGLDDDEIQDIINQIENKEGIDLSTLKPSDVSVVRDLLTIVKDKKDNMPHKAPSATSKANTITQITKGGTPTRFYINSKGKRIETSNSKGVVGNWEVSSITDYNTLQFDSKYTRDEVRMAYSKILNTKFTNTRAKKIK
jgi:hypothetical protein